MDAEQIKTKEVMNRLREFSEGKSLLFVHTQRTPDVYVSVNRKIAEHANTMVTIMKPRPPCAQPLVVDYLDLPSRE